MKKVTLILLALLAVVLSCKQLIDFLPDREDKSGLLLSNVFADGKLFNEFFYDEENQLTLFNEYYEGILTRTESYAYDTAHRLHERRHDGFLETYSYSENGALLKIDKYFAATNKSWVEKYSHDASGRIESGVLYFNGEKIGEMSYEYDRAGNTTRRQEFNIKENYLSSEYRLTYDSRKNPFPLRFPMDMVQKNNIKTYYFYSITMSAPPPQYESIFEYNSGDLPVKETRLHRNSDKPVVYEYFYVAKNENSASQRTTRR